MAEKLQKGDVVRLKSGGPYLCVEKPSGQTSNYVDLVWFEGSELMRVRLEEELLIKTK